MLTLEEIKTFIRIDNSEEDALLSSLKIASQNYIVNATHPNADTSDENFKLAQRFLIAHWYEKRDPVGKTEHFPFHLDSILTQITYTSSDET